jgi:hypothetical protein
MLRANLDPAGMIERPPNSAPAAGWTRAETLGTLAIVTLFWAALSLPWLSGALTIPWDAKAHFHPQLQFLARSLASGQSPFWNPHVFAGHPQIADPQSLIFSPPHLLAAWLFPAPAPVVGDAVLLAMLLMGALAMVGLFRDRGWAPAGAIVAALCFAFGAAAAWRIQHVGQAMSLVWFAVTLWLMARALARRSALWGLAAGVTGGLMVLGRDQVALIGVYTLIALTIAAWVQSPRPLLAIGRSIKPLAAMAVAVVLVAAVPILFTLMLAEQSNRPAIDLAGAGRGSLHPASLLTLVIANLFGAAGPVENFWGQPSPAWQARFGDVDLYLARNMSVLYIGALPLLAIGAMGVLRARLLDRSIVALTLIALAVLLYALGRYVPLLPLIYDWLPGFSFYRRPADAVFNLGALLAILAGYCVHVLISEDGETGKRWRWWAGGAALVAAFGGAVALAAMVGRLDVAARPLLIAMLVFVLAAATLLALKRAHRAAPLAAALFVAATLGMDLSVSNGPSESTGLPTAQYDVLDPGTINPTIARLKTELARTAAADRRDRIELAGVDFHWPNASMTHGLDHTLGYNPLRLGVFAAATGAQDHVALPDQRRFAPAMPGYRSVLADMLGLRFIVSRGELTAIDKALRPGDLTLIGRTSDGPIFENPRALPRVVVATALLRADTQEFLRTGAWPPGFDPRRAVVLEPNADAGGCQPAANAWQPQPTARIVSYANTRVEIAVTSPVCGHLVLFDSWQRWWRATVNGVDAEILRANLLFRAVPIPAGESTIVFAFAPFEGLAEDLARRAPAGMGQWLAKVVARIDSAILTASR